MVTIFLLKVSKVHNSIKNIDGITVLNPCISFDHALYLFQVSQNISDLFQSYLHDFPVKIFEWT